MPGKPRRVDDPLSSLSPTQRGGADKHVSTASRRALTTALVLATLAHVVALYTPGSPELDTARGVDKLAHVMLFAVPAALAWLVGGRARRWGPFLLVGHAVVSEMVQARFVANRAGDPLDALADVVGVALGVALARALWRSRPDVPAASDAFDPGERTDDGGRRGRR